MQVIAIYTRETKARGREENVEVQAELGTKYAAAHWPNLPTRLYCDNDITAADDDVFRPDYDRLLTDIRKGDVAQVVAPDQERLTRLIHGWEELSGILRIAGIWAVHGYRDGVTPVKLGQTAGGRYKAVAAAEYVEGVKIKVLEKHATLAAEGRPRGGIEYGYRPGRNDRKEATLEVVEAEAAVVRWVAEKLLAGWSLNAVAQDLNRRGVTTLHGRRWSATTVRRMISKPTIAGLRSADTRGTWDPIIDVATWRQVCQLLDSRATAKRRARRKFLLTGGIAECGRCDAGMGAQQRTVARPKGIRPIYFCKPPSLGGCSKVSIGADELEAHVAARLFDELEQHPEFFAALADVGDDSERDRIEKALDVVDTDRRDYARQRARRQITQSEWQAMREEYDAQEAELSAALAALPAPGVDVDPAEVRGAWDDMTLDERRELIGMFVERVVVAPAKPGTRKFDAGRVSIEWKTT